MVLRNLPDDSALHRLDGVVPVELQLAALTVDGVQARVWQSSKDGEKGTNQPKSVYDQLTNPQRAAKAPSREELDEFDRWYAARFNRHQN